MLRGSSDIFWTVWQLLILRLAGVMQAVLMDDNVSIEIEVTARKTGMGGSSGGI